MPAPAVFDSSPLVFLAGLGYASHLPELFEVWVPPVVLDELSARPARAGAALVGVAWLRRAEANTSDALTLAASLNLDAGETSVIALALEKGWVAVLDDALARKRARRSGLSVIGTLGILLLMYRARLVEADFEADIGRLQEQGMWRSEKVIGRARSMVKF